EVDVETVAAAACPGRGRSLLGRYRALVAEYQGRARSSLGIVEEGARLHGVADVRDTYVGPHAVIDGATAVVDSTLLSSGDRPTQVVSGAYVAGSLLQYGSRVSTFAVV